MPSSQSFSSYYNQPAKIGPSDLLDEKVNPYASADYEALSAIKDNAPGSIPAFLSSTDSGTRSDLWDDFSSRYQHTLPAISRSEELIGTTPDNSSYASPWYFFKNVYKNIRNSVGDFQKHLDYLDKVDRNNPFYRYFGYLPYLLFQRPVTLYNSEDAHPGYTFKESYDHPTGVFSPYLSLFTQGNRNKDLNSSLASYLWEGAGDLYQEGLNRLVSWINPLSSSPTGLTTDQISSFLNAPGERTTYDLRDLHRALHYGVDFHGQVNHALTPSSSLGYERLRSFSNRPTNIFNPVNLVKDPKSYLSSLGFHAADFLSFPLSSDFLYLHPVNSVASKISGAAKAASAKPYLSRLEGYQNDVNSLASVLQSSDFQNKITRDVFKAMGKDASIRNNPSALLDNANKSFYKFLSESHPDIASKLSSSGFSPYSLPEDMFVPEGVRSLVINDALGAASPSLPKKPFYLANIPSKLQTPIWMFGASPAIGLMSSYASRLFGDESDLPFQTVPAKSIPPLLSDILSSPRLLSVPHDYGIFGTLRSQLPYYKSFYNILRGRPAYTDGGSPYAPFIPYNLSTQEP